MLCNSCGHTVNEDAKFCNKCGKEIEKPVEDELTEGLDTLGQQISCNNCGNVVNKGAKFCNKCGKPMGKKVEEELTEALALDQHINCNNCGAAMEGNELFCGECGNPINNTVNKDVGLDEIENTPKKKESLGPLITVLILVIAVSASSIGYMLHRATRPLSIEIPDIEEVYANKDQDEGENKNSTEDMDGDKVEPVIADSSDMEVHQTSSMEDVAIADEGPVGEDVHYIEDGYMYPSDTTYISEEYLSELTREEINLLRNEIFARHGYIFNSEAYNSYFSQKSWYTPDESYDGSLLSGIEKDNIDIIIEYMEKMGWQ